jgi:carbamoyltransferase
VSTWVLGISCFYHDASAALVRDGEIVAAVQEERFTRKKADPRFPVASIDYCLEQGGIEPGELSAVVFHDNPLLTLDRILKTLLNRGPAAQGMWRVAAPNWLGLKARVRSAVHEKLQVDVPVLYSEHHMSHAAAAYYPSPFDAAAIVSVDGVGEWATTAIGEGCGGAISLIDEIHFPHSLGLLYSAFTTYCGFKVNSGEYKLMGLAAYGEPTYEGLIRDHLIDLKDDGSYRLNLDFFGFLDGESMTNSNFDDLFGGPPRSPESWIERRHMDLAASVQAVTNDVVVRLAAHAGRVTGHRNIALAGGVALNCVANGVLLRSGRFDRVWVQPAAGDAGSALGAALLVSHQELGIRRPDLKGRSDRQRGSYLGPAFSNGEVRAYLDRNGFPYEVVSDQERARLVAKLLADQKIVAYMVGRAEFGPRALGARSILGDARSYQTQSMMNLKIKFRESFRPFAPSVLLERCADYFELQHDSPYMLLVAPVREERRLPRSAEPAGDDMLAIVSRPRSDIPAVTHVDYTARVQTVTPENKPDYYAILKEFEALTGDAVIVNTSFNLRSEPIVLSPRDAYTCFRRSNIDVLVMENCVLYRDQQPPFEDTEDWRARLDAD